MVLTIFFTLNIGYYYHLFQRKKGNSAQLRVLREKMFLIAQYALGSCLVILGTNLAVILAVSGVTQPKSVGQIVLGCLFYTGSQAVSFIWMHLKYRQWSIGSKKEAGSLAATPATPLNIVEAAAADVVVVVKEEKGIEMEEEAVKNGNVKFMSPQAVDTQIMSIRTEIIPKTKTF